MELSVLKVRQDFDAWFRKTEDIWSDDSEGLAYYGKPEIEQQAYLLAFFESKGIVILPEIYVGPVDAYSCKIYDRHLRVVVELPLKYDTKDKAIQSGILHAEDLLRQYRKI